MLVVANAANAVAYASSEPEKLKTKALKTLVLQASDGHMNPLKCLPGNKTTFKARARSFLQVSTVA